MNENTKHEHRHDERRGLVAAAVVLGLAFVTGVAVFTWAWSGSRAANQTINVTGSAKMAFVSDLGILHGTLSVMAPSQAGAYRELQGQKPALLAYLAEKGFPEGEVEWDTENSHAEWNWQNGQRTSLRGWVYSQRISVQSPDVQKIKELSLSMNELVERGVSFTVDPPEFHYTNLQDLKVQVQAMAAKDAMERAQKVAEATGSSLGPLRNARMGVLQITPPNSTNVSDYGINDVSSIEKEITAVVSGDFQLE